MSLPFQPAPPTAHRISAWEHLERIEGMVYTLLHADPKPSEATAPQNETRLPVPIQVAPTSDRDTPPRGTGPGM